MPKPLPHPDEFEGAKVRRPAASFNSVSTRIIVCVFAATVLSTAAVSGLSIRAIHRDLAGRVIQGFAELAKFDDNGNGFIDPGDDIWQYLYLWRPKQDLLTMTEAKLGAFSVSSAATPMPLLDKQQQKQGEIQRSGLAFTDDARPVLVQQIDLVV